MALPDIINHQDALLTLSTSEIPVVKDFLPGVDLWPLFLDTENGTWVVRAKFAPDTTLPKHFHTGSVHFYTLSGSWHYLEYPDQPQTEGSYLYEPGGSIHTLHSPDGADGFIIVHGSNINFHDDGEFMNIMDAGWIAHMCYEVSKAQGLPKPRFIEPKAEAGYSDE